jgi:hypothetical protein
MDEKIEAGHTGHRNKPRGEGIVFSFVSSKRQRSLLILASTGRDICSLLLVRQSSIRTLTGLAREEKWVFRHDCRKASALSVQF